MLPLQCAFRVDQLDQGQLVEGWFPLTLEDGTSMHKHRAMVNVVLQYQSVLQVNRHIQASAFYLHLIVGGHRLF